MTGAAPLIAYPALLAAHLAAVALFVAGLLIAGMLLPGLTAAPVRSAAWRLEVRRLRAIARYATTPALLLVWGFGIAMAIEAGWFASRWLEAKLVLVVALSAWHGRQLGVLGRLATDGAVAPMRSGTTIAAVAAIVGIVALAVIKPF